MLRQVGFLLALLVCVPGTVHAQSRASQEQIQQAQEHFSRAELAFRQGRWLDCATHFEQSFTTVFAPELLYNIGLCYERAADTVGDADSIPYMQRAVDAYSRYLRELPQAEDAAAIRVRIADLRLLLDRARMAAADEAAEEVEISAVEEAEEAPRDETTDEDGAITIPEVVVSAPVDRGFGFGWTLTGGAFTLASFVTAVGLGVAAQLQFEELSSTCGQTATGCSPLDVEHIVTLATSANVMFVVSGVLLAATGVAFGLEFHLWSTPAETHVNIGYSQAF